MDQGDGSGAWSSPGEGPGAGGDELQSPIVAGTLSVRAEVLGPWRCDWGLSFILRMRRPLGAQALLDPTVPLCLGDLPCPCLVAADASGLLSALGARPGGRQGDWLVRGKMLGFLLTVPLLALLGAPLTPVPAATPPTREAQLSQASPHERGLQPCSGSSGPSHSPCTARWPFPVAAGLWADSRSLAGVSALLSCVNTPGLHGPSEDPGVFSAFRRKPI